MITGYVNCGKIRTVMINGVSTPVANNAQEIVDDVMMMFPKADKDLVKINIYKMLKTAGVRT